MLPNSIEVSIKGVVKRKHFQVSFQKIYHLTGYKRTRQSKGIKQEEEIRYRKQEIQRRRGMM